jgi:hypothetical protein
MASGAKSSRSHKLSVANQSPGCPLSSWNEPQLHLPGQLISHGIVAPTQPLQGTRALSRCYQRDCSRKDQNLPGIWIILLVGTRTLFPNLGPFLGLLRGAGGLSDLQNYGFYEEEHATGTVGAKFCSVYPSELQRSEKPGFFGWLCPF